MKSRQPFRGPQSRIVFKLEKFETVFEQVLGQQSGERLETEEIIIAHGPFNKICVKDQ
jgi:hypothetical protein